MCINPRYTNTLPNCLNGEVLILANQCPHSLSPGGELPGAEVAQSEKRGASGAWVLGELLLKALAASVHFVNPGAPGPQVATTCDSFSFLWKAFISSGGKFQSTRIFCRDELTILCGKGTQSTCLGLGLVKGEMRERKSWGKTVGEVSMGSGFTRPSSVALPVSPFSQKASLCLHSSIHNSLKVGQRVANSDWP